ncbi:MAG: hypothetical protein HRO68_00905 [Nitrosopumilus sp.]|nr:hypothetical protein [Nitrosopumilus sp.]
MTTMQKKLILVSVLIVSLVTLSGIAQPQIFAEETEKKQYTKANDIAIHTVFDFNGEG